MQHKKIPLADTKAFSSFFLDYIQQKETLSSFYHRFPVPENFKDQIKEKSTSFSQASREALVTTLQKQYAHLTPPESVINNINLLGDAKTFTITTGHQLNLFTGPLYFIYKIVTVINTCKRLQERHPEFNFVPVYWMASEDHDYDEIKYFRLYGKKYVWETTQSGAVGRFRVGDMASLLQEIPGDISIFKEAYTRNETLADAARQYVNALFGSEGLVVLDADDRTLKSGFRPVMEEDILQNTTVRLVDETNKKLSALGYKAQVFCRDINFFYLDQNIRARIEKKDESYHIVETGLNFQQRDISEMIEHEPEKLSPNVILRPLYQEWILPNLAYVGGPSENVYWLQLKNVFNHYKIPFPLLMPRNFALVVDHTTNRKMKKTGLDLIHFFEEKNFLYNHWVLKNSEKNLTVGAEREAIRQVYDGLIQRAEAIDKTLGPFTRAEATRVVNGLEKIERRLLRAEKRNKTDKLRQIDEVKDAMFPNGSLQERTDNFLNFYQRDKDFIRKLADHFDPFDYSFNVLTSTGT